MSPPCSRQDLNPILSSSWPASRRSSNARDQQEPRHGAKAAVAGAARRPGTTPEAKQRMVATESMFCEPWVKFRHSGCKPPPPEALATPRQIRPGL
ncbi:hypothetical protein ZWY2020_011290 [Hordeum vulgare]|nr:hypothetical protein ZWY2020_011290 [Hordeum vulgare]